MVIRSYVRSTDNHCESRSKYIFPSINVPIDACCLTARAIPTANIKRHFIHYKTAMVTSFTAGEKSVNLDQFSPIPFTLILKLTKHFAPSSIANTTSQLVILDHVSNGKVFNSDYAIERLTKRLVNLCRKSVRASLIWACILATSSLALYRLFEPLVFRLNSFCATLSF